MPSAIYFHHRLEGDNGAIEGMRYVLVILMSSTEMLLTCHRYDTESYVHAFPSFHYFSDFSFLPCHMFFRSEYDIFITCCFVLLRRTDNT